MAQHAVAFLLGDREDRAVLEAVGKTECAVRAAEDAAGQVVGEEGHVALVLAPGAVKIQKQRPTPVVQLDGGGRFIFALLKVFDRFVEALDQLKAAGRRIGNQQLYVFGVALALYEEVIFAVFLVHGRVDHCVFFLAVQ